MQNSINQHVKISSSFIVLYDDNKFQIKKEKITLKKEKWSD